jgi:hypothetical protein
MRKLDHAEIKRLHFDEGLGIKKIADMIGTRRDTVSAICRGISRHEQAAEPSEKTEAAARRAAIYANVWHLVDLKRAGHSPRQTELNVPHDDSIATAQIRAASYGNHASLSGSPGAMCAESTGNYKSQAGGNNIPKNKRAA